jgi:SlyX protein
MDNAAPEERLVAIESAVAHLQHNYEQLHHTLLAIQADLRGLRQALARLDSCVEKLQQDPEVRSPEAERPPHY